MVEPSVRLMSHVCVCGTQSAILIVLFSVLSVFSLDVLSFCSLFLFSLFLFSLSLSVLSLSFCSTLSVLQVEQPSSGRVPKVGDGVDV